MARVHTVTAAKDYPQQGIKKGDTYYRWKRKLPSGGGWVSREFKSKTYPKRSQMTSSEFLGTVYDLDDAIDAATCPDDLKAVVDDIRQLGLDQDEKLSNMPDNLQQSANGELLQERASQCEEWADAVEAAASSWQEALDAEEDDEEKAEGEEAEALGPSDFKADCASPF